MGKIQRSLIVLVAFLFVMVAFEAKAQNVQLGKEVYEKKCWGCHGLEGKGDGPAAERLQYQPRNFTLGDYEYRSTLGGELPLDKDLVRTVTNGLSRAGMPGFGDALKEKEIEAVVAYIKTFSERFANEKPPAPIKVPTIPQPTDELLAKGKQWFEDLECFKCHGNNGRADGESAKDLEDDLGNPIRPANLTQPWKFNRGSTPEDIYMTFFTGLSGTPMPAFGDVFETPEETDEALIPLAVYVSSLQEKPNYKSLVKSSLLEGDIPMDPNDAIWQGLEKVAIELVGQIIQKPRYFTPSVDHLNIRSLNNGKEIAFLLEWDDPSESTKKGKVMVEVEDPETFEYIKVEKTAYPDSIALQFPQVPLSDGPEMPYFLGGDKQRPVYLWKWNADTSSVVEMNSSALNEEKAQPADSQTVESKTSYKDGLWTMVVKRSLVTDDEENDLQLQPGNFYPLAFNAWDGGLDETGKKRSVTTWRWVFLEKPTPMKLYIYPPVAIVLAVAFQFWLRGQVTKKD